MVLERKEAVSSIVSATFSIELRQPKTCFGQSAWEEFYPPPSTQKPLLLTSTPENTGKPGVLGLTLFAEQG